MTTSGKRIVIFGSTGTIGRNALDVIQRFPGRFEVVGLTAYNNIDILQRQIRKFSPRYVAVGGSKIAELKSRLSDRGIRILNADSDLSFLAALPEVDIVLMGMSGAGALDPFLKAVAAGKTVAPANKEALVIAGHLIMQQAKRSGAKIIPIDSEQSAIFQCLDGRNRRELKRVYLTASGGPLHRIPKKEFGRLRVSDILRHPRWKMGKKITVDSATLLNKAFEVIEAMRLFDLQVDQIRVLIHPESIIHSLVEFQDGSILAQLGITDMRLPIQYALTYPERWATSRRELDLFQVRNLTFERPDIKKFPALALGLDAAAKGGTYPSVLNAADEVAVHAFLSGKIPFMRIYDVLEYVMARHRGGNTARYQDILAADTWARNKAEEYIAVKR